MPDDKLYYDFLQSSDIIYKIISRILFLEFEGKGRGRYEDPTDYKR